MNKVVLDGISDNISALVHNRKYGAINTAYSTTVVYYVVNLLFEAYMLQYNKAVEKQVIKSVEIILKA